jgi:hypothetical protein
MEIKNISLKRFRANLLERGQNVAGRLSAFFERYPAGKKKAALVFFCMVCSSISICIVASSMSGKSRKPFSSMQFHVPPHIGKNTREPGTPVSDEVFQRIERFRKYLDTISRADKKAFDNMILTRPHLLDSITLFEKLYQAQSKK